VIEARATPSPQGVREWWLRTVLVVQAPRPVFAALRDDGDEAVGNRSEPVLLIVLLSGIAYVLSTATAAHLLDDRSYDDSLVAIWTFLAGSMYGIVGYWVLGAVLYGGLRALGSLGSYRRARHLLAFAAVPVALSLALLPVKLALFGGAIFHRGGSDAGAAGSAFVALDDALLAWAVVLLVIGVRTVHAWTWSRSAAAVGVAAALPAALSLAALAL
jgi:hypothetical protein